MRKFQEFLCGFFSRTLAFIFTYGFLKIFSRTNFCFHGQFLRYFHGRKTNFTDGKPKIFENFHGRDFDFHGGEKTLHVCGIQPCKAANNLKMWGKDIIKYN